MRTKKLKPLPLYRYMPITLSAMKRRVLILLNLGWTQGAHARNKNGEVVDRRSVNVYSVCLSGAVNRAAGLTGDFSLLRSEFLCLLSKKCLEKTNSEYINDFNDNPVTTKRDVIEFVKSVSV